MKIAVLSGKGGTGKTFVSVNLAEVAHKATYLDCDVEEPNGDLFFKSKKIFVEDVKVRIPEVDRNLCDGCRKCVDFCKFNALAYVGDSLLIFDDVCHSCGGCILACPKSALSEREKVIGKVNIGWSKDTRVVEGRLNTGEESGTPVVNQVLNESKNAYNDVIIDCPPGSACMVMDSIKDVDFCVLVAEPTIFGCHNLKMVYELCQLMNKPFGVVLNKCMEEANPSEEFCKKNNIEILGKIYFDQELGRKNSSGEIISRIDSEYRKIFKDIFERIQLRGKIDEAVVNS